MASWSMGAGVGWARGLRQRDRRAVVGGLARGAAGRWLAWALVVSAAACGEPESIDRPAWLEQVQGPTPLLAGSPLRVKGQGLAGGLLLLRTAVGEGRARVRPAVATAHASAGAGLPSAVPWRDAEILTAAAPGVVREICLAADDGAQAAVSCVAASAGGAELAFGTLAPLVAPTLRSGGAATLELAAWLGDRLEVQAAGLPLPGEGEVWFELEGADADVTLPAGATLVAHDVPWSRDRAWIRSEEPGLGVVPGTRAFRMRVARRLGGGEVERSPWSEALAVTLALSTLTWPGHGAAPLPVRRGRATDIAWPAEHCPEGAAIELVGTWSSAWESVVWPAAQPRSLPFRALADGSCRAVLPAATFAADGWAELAPEALFDGEATVRLGSWRGLAKPIAMRLVATSQVVELRFDAGVALGLHRFGLGLAAAAIEARVRALVQSHVEGLHIAWVEAAGPDVVDFVRVRVLGDDPNGLGLLGTEPSLGKDDGNLRWDESLDGFCAEAWLAGVPAWGGVFVSSFLRFSPTLTLSAAADPRFDAIFGPFAPELGGTPAHDAASLAAASTAIEALAQLLAGTISHEVGHALGLAAGTPEVHHPADHPGWRMDAGPARPFAERAGLPDAMAEIWGEIDQGYLETTLAK